MVPMSSVDESGDRIEREFQITREAEAGSED